MKKLLKIMLATLLALSVFPVAACSAPEKQAPAQPEVKTEKFVFTYNESTKNYTAKATDACKNLESITIPAKINGYPVSTVADYSFMRFAKLKNVVVSEGITVIGMSAFYECTALEAIQLPSTLVAIKQSAFENCVSLQRVQLPEKIRSLGNGAFMSCKSLTYAPLPANLQAIPNDLFGDCNLMTVTIPEKVRKIGNGAFAYNHNLSEVKLNQELSEIGSSAFQGCGALEEILFPRNESLRIGDYAFAETGLKKVYLPSNVSLGTYTFMKLAWDDTIENPGDKGSPGASKCEGIYYESPEGDRGTNTFGYTWNRPDLGFHIYVPTGSLSYYMTANPGDESWMRCVVNSVNSHNNEYSVLQEYDINEVFPDGFPVAKY